MNLLWALLLAVGPHTADLRSDKSPLTLGAEETATLTLRAPGVRAEEVKFSCNIGQIGLVEAAGPDEVRAVFAPSGLGSPAVALIAARYRSVSGAPEVAFLALPLQARKTLRLRTKPNAKVEIRIAGNATSGTSDPRGDISLEVIIPPGAAYAELRARDRAGNKSTRSVPLHVPPASRLFLVSPVDPPTASWADTTPLALAAFVVDSYGHPASSVEVAATVDRGTLTPFKPAGKGVYRSTFQAPNHVGEAHAQVRAWLPDDAASMSSLDVTLRASAPANLRIDVPDELKAGARQLTGQVVVLDEKGNRVEAPELQATTDFGQLTFNSATRELKLDVPPQWGDRQEVHLEVRSGALSAHRSVRLLRGPAARVVATVDPGQIPAGQAAILRLKALDAFGNAGTAEPITASADAATLSSFTTDPGGEQTARMDVSPDAPVGRSIVQLRVGHASPLNIEFVVLPSRPRFGASFSAIIGEEGNFNGLWGTSAALEGSVRLSSSAGRAFIQAGGLFGRLSPRAVAGSAEGATVHGSLTGLRALAGVAYAEPLSAHLSVEGVARAGLQRSYETLELAGGTAAGLTQHSVVNSFVLGGVLRVKVLAGPGEVFIGVGAQTIPSRSIIYGDLGGFLGQAGYQLSFR